MNHTALLKEDGKVNCVTCCTNVCVCIYTVSLFFMNLFLQTPIQKIIFNLELLMNDGIINNLQCWWKFFLIVLKLRKMVSF